MKLHSAQFERELKRMVRTTIRSSPELKREHRRVKSYRKNLNLAWLWRLAFASAIGFAIRLVQQETGHITTALAAVGIYLLLMLCFRIQSLLRKLNFSADQPALNMLPVGAEIIFRWQIQKFFRESCYVLFDLMVIFTVLAWANDFPLWKWAITFLYVITTWFSLLGLAALCAFRFPRWPFPMISSGLIMLGVVVFFGRSVIGPFALHLLDSCASMLNILLPTAWPVSSFELLCQGKNWWLPASLLPVAFIIGSLKASLNGLRTGLLYREVVFQPASDLVPGEDSKPSVQPETPRHLGPTEIEGIVTSGLFMAQPGDVLRHLPEKKLWAWLTARERALAEFAHPSGLAIGSAWKKIYVVLLATCLLVLVTGLFNPIAQLVIFGLGAFAVFCLALANLANHGRAFVPVRCGGVNVPMYASYGIGFNELTRFFFKYSIIQLPFLFGAFVVLGGISAWCLKQPLTMGIIFGFKVAGLMFAGRSILNVFAFSSGTNDSSRFRLSSFLLVIGVVMFGLTFLGLGTACLIVPFTLPAFSLWAGALLDAWLFFWIYGWFYRFCRFDLMSLPRR